jgi:dTDP-4-dehydrorhamnose reductase
MSRRRRNKDWECCLPLFGRSKIDEHIKVVKSAETNKSILRMAVVMNHYGNWKEKRLERKKREKRKREREGKG